MSAGVEDEEERDALSMDTDPNPEELSWEESRGSVDTWWPRIRSPSMRGRVTILIALYISAASVGIYESRVAVAPMMTTAVEDTAEVVLGIREYLIEAGDIKTITIRPLDEANISPVLFDGWIDPESIELGVLAVMRLKPSLLFKPMYNSGTYASLTSQGHYSPGCSERDSEGQYHLELPLHFDEVGIHTPVVFSLKSVMVGLDQRMITKLWRIAVPENCIEDGVKIEPCIYASRLAFHFTPDIEMAQVVLVYSGRPDVTESLGLKKVGENGVYAHVNQKSAKWLRERGLASPDRLWIWDSEKDSLNYTGQKMFFVYGITPNTGTGEHVIFSDVYIS